MDQTNREGTLLCNGQFRLLRRLDDGGTARLYLAESQPGARLCVVKELHPSFEWKKRAVLEAMFEDEARLLQHLSKEDIAIPQFYDSFMDSGAFYIVLEFIPGQNLEQYMQQQGSGLPVAEVMDYIRQVVAVLSVIHTLAPNPVIHGDIKPSNLIRRPNGQVAVIDFGLAQADAPMPPYVPARASAFGTPGYTPLEQWEGHVTPASDIFALGATMHQLLTGRNPSAPFERMARVNFSDLATLTSFPALNPLLPAVPPLLDLLIAQMLRRRPADRPTAEELRIRLSQLSVLLTL